MDTDRLIQEVAEMLQSVLQSDTLSCQSKGAEKDQAIGQQSGSLAEMIDHTLLKPNAAYDQIEKLCMEAREYQFALCASIRPM